MSVSEKVTGWIEDNPCRITLLRLNRTMNVSYQHANPYDGNESFLLRFEQEMGQTACILVDAGAGVDIDDLLGDDKYLTAVLLTHAHSDHTTSPSPRTCALAHPSTRPRRPPASSAAF